MHLCRLDMNQREKGYWADLDNLKQELAFIASKKGPSAGSQDDSMLDDDERTSAHEEGDPSLPQHASEGETLPHSRVSMPGLDPSQCRAHGAGWSTGSVVVFSANLQSNQTQIVRAFAQSM